jgi:hypothetical protein
MAKAAEVAHHTVACEPLLCISTRQSACATRWSPHARDELVCAYANAHELHVFDLGSATPSRPVRRLRSAKAYAATQGVADVAFPARILAKTGKIVTINRGDGTGIAAGQLWEVFALGEELTDPDTGASLGREEVKVGQVRIQRVTARTAQGEVSGEDLGIDRGAIVRRVEQ